MFRRRRMRADSAPGARERLRSALARSRARLAGRIGDTLRSGRAGADLLEELEQILYEADLGVRACEQVIEGLGERLRRQQLSSAEQVTRALREELLEILGQRPPSVAPAGSARPRVILVLGVNGSGKTTTIGKLAHRFRGEGKKVLIAAADTFRAAAIDQLAVWAERAGAELIHQAPGTDPAAVTFDALAAARARAADILLVDTAGRLHTKLNLMEELKKLRRVLRRADPSMPHESLLVLDGVSGQNGLVQARQFHDAIGLSGVVLTKIDGTAKGGVVLAVAAELGIAVRLVGVGEGIDDLQDFDPELFVDEILRAP